MKKTHELDLDYKFSSRFLKSILTHFGSQLGSYCLEMPCGNGRNTFLLTKHFPVVTAIDLNLDYLNAINSYRQFYKSSELVTIQSNILTQTPAELESASFICIIHFYDFNFIRHTIEKARSGAFIILETMGCNGNNFIQLLTRDDINSLFFDVQVLKSEFNICRNSLNQRNRGALKALIRIL